MKGFNKVALLALASTIGLSYGCSSTNMGMSPFPTFQPLLNAPQYSTYNRGDMKKWTIMVHLGADNNLNSFGYKDMDEMAAGLKSSEINVIVLFDGSKQGDSAIYKMKPGGKDLVDDGGVIIPASKEIDSGDPKVLAKFKNSLLNIICLIFGIMVPEYLNRIYKKQYQEALIMMIMEVIWKPAI